MKDFRLYNRLLGWLVMLISAFVYLSTIEPSTSLWDCGEFIASAYKLQVGHPPGAPFFLILAKFFSLFAGKDVTKIALMINSMSALASAFTIMFLFWTITHLALKLVDTEKMNLPRTIAILGSGLIGALAYTFSDTFWFSAVEGEVYASSSLFTAIIFWAILKWENEANEKYANRWLILIAYLMGLSIGVHLLNLLAIPAIVLVYYFKKFKTTTPGVIIALAVSAMLLFGIMYGIIPGLVKVASSFELFFVNSLGMPFNSGVIIYFILLITIIIAGIYISHKEKFSVLQVAMMTSFSLLLIGIFWTKAGLILNIIITIVVGFIFKALFEKRRDILNLILVSSAVIILGYSSFSIIVIRSLAEPPMNENDPETVFSLQSYLNREQYGDHPLVYGRYFNNLYPVDMKVTGAVYFKGEKKYEKIQDKIKYKWSPDYNTVFPRMYSNAQKGHIDQYLQWADINEGDVYMQAQDKDGNLKYDENGNPVYDRRRPNKKPKFSQNLRFFMAYQVSHMYFRYFLWNFSGRQNNQQSNAGPLYGNAITGLNFIDKHFVGDLNDMPDEMKNDKSRNTFFLLPLILGFIGMFFHLNRHKKDFWVVMVLFILTGIAIVIYLNQTPLQPRERDYAYAGSFYAFAIWIGLGVMALIRAIDKQYKNSAFGIVITAGMLFLIPGIMAKENWDDHDRSGRYTARDIAADYLNSCAPNAILFSNGDNDTFPLWYAQEVEGIRTDVRVVNLMLLNMDWYIEQMTKKVYDSDPLPISLSLRQYLGNKNDQIAVESRKDTALYLKDIVEYIADDDERTKSRGDGRRLNCSPVTDFIIPVDSAKVVQNGTVAPEDANLVVNNLRGTFSQKEYGKSDLIVMDILAHNNWKRPIYFVSERHSATFGLEDYFQLDGFAYRLVPIKSDNPRNMLAGHINTNILYNNFMNKFKYGRMNADDVYMDNFHIHTVRVIMMRQRFALLADALIKEGKPEKAKKVLNKITELTPNDKIPYDPTMLPVAGAYYKLGDFGNGNAIISKYLDIERGQLNFFLSQNDKLQKYYNNEMLENLEILYRITDLVKGHGQKDMENKIVQLLDTLSEFQLEKKMPLQYYMRFIAEPYYNLGEFEKGNEKYRVILANANGFLSNIMMNPSLYGQSSGQQIGLMFSIIREIGRNAEMHGQKELANDAYQILNNQTKNFTAPK